jgi:NNP family nitrate/nitrite transporter-like MFS transporter
VFLGFYVICAMVTWFVFLRLRTARAGSGEHIGRAPALVLAS